MHVATPPSLKILPNGRYRHDLHDFYHISLDKLTATPPQTGHLLNRMRENRSFAPFSKEAINSLAEPNETSPFFNNLTIYL